MIDLDALEAAVAEGEKKNFFVAPIVKELIAELRERRAQVDGYRMTLLAEVERLRGEVSYLRACVPPTRPTDYGHEVWTAALRAEVAAERAAVVAWLRGEPERLVKCNGHRHADGKPCWVMSPMPADELADCIERGEHRREEER